MRSGLIPLSTPIRKQPTTLTVMVPTGSPIASDCALVNLFTPCRAIDPSAPPIPTANQTPIAVASSRTESGGRIGSEYTDWPATVDRLPIQLFRLDRIAAHS